MNKPSTKRLTLTLTVLLFAMAGGIESTAQETAGFKLRSHPSQHEPAAGEIADAPDYAAQLQALEDALRIERAKREVLREDLQKARREIQYLSDTIVQMKREQISYARKLDAIQGDAEPAAEPASSPQPQASEEKRVTRRSWRYLQKQPAEPSGGTDTVAEEKQEDKPSLLQRIWPFGSKENSSRAETPVKASEPGRPAMPMLPGEQLDSSETLSGRISAPRRSLPTTGNDLFHQACAQYEQGRLREAAALCDQFLASEPKHAQALGLRGIIAFGENDLQNASLLLRRALREERNDAQLHSYMGVVLHAQGKHRAAVRELHDAVMLDPQNSEVHFNLAVVQATAPRGNLREARDAYEMALSLGNRRDESLEALVYR